jgi:heme/copper-type cytochrome/quinol oxidase subunit 4
MVTKCIIQIAMGLLLWLFVPGWITQGSRKTRQWIKLACNIAGIVMVISGSLRLLSAVGSVMF